MMSSSSFPSRSSSPQARCVWSLFAVALLSAFAGVCGDVATAQDTESPGRSPSLRERYLAATDPDHDGSLVRFHSVEHDKFHGRRVLETVGVGLHVWVAYRNPDGKAHVQSNLTEVGVELESFRAVAGVLPSYDKLVEMLEDQNIDWIAEDSIIKGAAETQPYGVNMVTQNQYRPNQYVAQGSSASCSNPNTFKIGIIDSGMTIL